MSKKSHRSISDLPGQVSEEEAARMAGAGREKPGGTFDPETMKGISLGLQEEPSATSSSGSGHDTPPLGANHSDPLSRSSSVQSVKLSGSPSGLGHDSVAKEKALTQSEGAKTEVKDADLKRSIKVSANLPLSEDGHSRASSGTVEDGPHARSEPTPKVSRELPVGNEPRKVADKPAAHADPLNWNKFKSEVSDPKKWTPNFGFPSEDGRMKEFKTEVGKADSRSVEVVGKITNDLILEKTREAAMRAGGYHQDKGEISDHGAKATETKGSKTTATVSGWYEDSHTKTFSYAVANSVAGAGAGASIEVVKGWENRVTETTNRFGVTTKTIEMWTDVNIARSADASAEISSAGAVKAKATVYVAVSAESGIAVTIYDPSTGVTVTKAGKISAEASANASLDNRITWDRSQIGFKAGGDASIGAEAEWTLMTADQMGVGLSPHVKLGTAAQIERKISFRSNPVDGYGFRFAAEDYVAAGVTIGAAAKMQTDVAKLGLSLDALVGQATGKFKIDGGWKEGVLRLELTGAKAAGLGVQGTLSVQVDVKQWGKNIDYRVGKAVKDLSSGDFLSTCAGVAKLVSPIRLLFDLGDGSAPKPPNHNKTFGMIAGPTTADDCVKHIKAAAKMPELLKELEELRLSVPSMKGLGVVYGLKHTMTTKAKAKAAAAEAKIEEAKEKFLDLKEKYRDILTFQPMSWKEFMERDHKHLKLLSTSPTQISEEISEKFGKSDDAEVKALELSFKSLPGYVVDDFQMRADPANAQNKIPDVTHGAYSAFSGQLSLVQYLSITEHQKVAKMDKAAADKYLQGDSEQNAHLTTETKERLLAFWKEVQENERKADPPPYGEAPQNPANPSEKLENALWWLTKNADKHGKSEAQRVWELDLLAPGYQAYHGNSIVPSMEQWAYEFKGVPRGEDGHRLIDLTPVKEGKIGLKTLLLQREVETLSKLGSPQAVYEHMTKQAHHVTEKTKGLLMQKWLEKNLNGSWKQDSDPDARAAQVWWEQHRTDYEKMANTGVQALMREHVMFSAIQNHNKTYPSTNPLKAFA